VDAKAPVEWVEEPSYFFHLSVWQDKLLAFYDQHPDFIAPVSCNEVISFVKRGIKRFIHFSHFLFMGDSIPSNPKQLCMCGQGLTNYITALGYPDTNALDFLACECA